MLTKENKLDLVRAYNKLNKDEANLKRSAELVTCLDSYRHYNRIFDEQESKEVCSALEKCAKCYVENNASDEQKRDLGLCLKYFVIEHPENIPQVLNILDTLTDVDVIDPIRSCMSRDPSLLDQGFAAMHKSVNAICKKEKSDFAASWKIRVAFADLYDYFGHKNFEDVATIDRITKEFPSFENQIRREDAGSLYDILQSTYMNRENDAMKDELRTLSDAFSSFGKGSDSFTEHYNAIKNGKLNKSTPMRSRGGMGE